MHAKCSESLLYNSPKEESREVYEYHLLWMTIMVGISDKTAPTVDPASYPHEVRLCDGTSQYVLRCELTNQNFFQQSTDFQYF